MYFYYSNIIKGLADNQPLGKGKLVAVFGGLFLKMDYCGLTSAKWLLIFTLLVHDLERWSWHMLLKVFKMWYSEEAYLK